MKFSQLSFAAEDVKGIEINGDSTIYCAEAQKL